ncbi:MAG TPA: hypothetical protein VFR70_00520 [Flavobacterium sp.]|nr:hypothetical protein [Flavobacterium sp.]
MATSFQLYAQKTNLPIMELLFGPASTNAVVGNTRLTAGISKYGELVALRWPCPSHFDHLNYKTLYPIPWGWKAEDYNRYYNAGERQGSFAGLKYTIDGKEKITWLRSEEWQQKQGYYSNDAPMVVTTFTNQQLGIKVTITDWVDAQLDVLHRKFHIGIDNTPSPLKDVQLVHVANMAPCNKNKLFDASTEWIDDSKNGFATLYDKSRDAFLSFIPEKEDKDKLPSSSSSDEDIENFIQSMPAVFASAYKSGESIVTAKDIYCAISSDRQAAAISLIEDKSKRGSLPDLAKPYSNKIALGPAMCASYYNVLSDNAKTDEITVSFSFAPNAQDAFNNLKKIESNSSLEQTIKYWAGKLSKAKIPPIKDELAYNTLKRTLINILLSVNADAGMISGSATATQPPYTSGWTRDGAVLGLILDCAGFTKEAEENALFYARVQRKQDGQDCRKPEKGICYKGTWQQCYYADGRPSWVYDMEIDQVGWGLFIFYSHSLFLSPEDKKEYLKKIEPNIRMAADFLVDFKDPKNNLQKRAIEDDLPWKSQSSYGAATTVTGLKSAIESLKILNADDPDILKYELRLKEIEEAIEKEFWSNKEGQFDKRLYANFGPRAAIIWPANYLPEKNAKMLSHADALYEQISPYYKMQDKAKNKEWWYVGKTTTALAYLWKNDLGKRDLVEKYMLVSLRESCTSDTRIFGETPMVRDYAVIENRKKTAKRAYDTRVGLPHNMTAGWMYLTAEMLYGRSQDILSNLYNRKEK